MVPRASALVSVLAALVVGLPASACGLASGDRDAPPRAVPTEPGTAERAATSGTVVAISIDGLNPQALRKLGRDGTPRIHQMMRQGAGTLNARTELEQTVTLPNHTGMVTGRRIEAATGGHGVWWNDDRTVPATVQAAAGEDVASVFTVTAKAAGRPAVYAGKTKFSLWKRSWPDAIDTSVIDARAGRLVRAFKADLTDEERDFRFLHIALPDTAGHAHGFMGGQYLDAVRRSDRLVGRVLRTIRRDDDLRGSTTVILTADHGGKGPGHSDATKAYNYRVPFVVWGAGTAHGKSLYRLNPDYQNPRRGRPGYEAERQPVRNGDLANLALGLLGLPAVPGSELDADQGLDVE